MWLKTITEDSVTRSNAMAYLLAGGPEPGVKLEDVCNLTLMCTSEERSGFGWDLGEDRLPFTYGRSCASVSTTQLISRNSRSYEVTQKAKRLLDTYNIIHMSLFVFFFNRIHYQSTFNIIINLAVSSLFQKFSICHKLFQNQGDGPILVYESQRLLKSSSIIESTGQTLECQTQ